MIRDYTIDQYIGDKIVELDRIEAAAHQSSGKLTASMLGYPLQWQMLKILGVPQRPIEQYVLRKFIRGKQVEAWVVDQIEGVISKQQKVEYRDALGYADCVVMQKLEGKSLTIPHEIKSVTNMKFKRVVADGQADPSHKLQACFYALGLGLPYFAIDYVASDDLRVETFIYEVEETKPEVDKIISEFQAALATGYVPVFEPRYVWQSRIDFNNYPDWATLTEMEIKLKLSEKGGENGKRQTA